MANLETYLCEAHVALESCHTVFGALYSCVLLCCKGVAFASHAGFMVEQSERVHSTLGSAHLPAVNSIVSWRQCTSYVLQPVCGPLFLVLLLICEPAAEKSEVVGYKELKLN